MAASRKKRETKAQTPPIEGEILMEEVSGPDDSRDGVSIFRHFVWYLTGAGVVFIAGLIAAPIVQEKIDSLFGKEDPAPVAESVPVAKPLPGDSAMPGRVRQDEQPASENVAVAATKPAAPTTPTAPTETEAISRVTAAEEPAAALLPERESVTGPEPAPGPEQESGPSAVPAQVGEIAQRLARRMDLLEARLAELEATERVVVTTAGADGLLLALARLSQRVDGGQAFSGEMLEFRTLFEALPAAARRDSESHAAALADHAGSGVKNPAALQRDFATALPAALEAAALPRDAGWWDKVWVQLKSVVVVRRTGQVAGDDARAILARAEFHLAQGNIAAALAETDRLEAQVADILSSWRRDAANTLAARQAVDALITAYSVAPTTVPAAGPTATPAATPEKEDG